MGTFTHIPHSPDDLIFVNSSVYPLTFFLTVEAAYALPSGATSQRYEQTVERYSSDGTTQTLYTIPWTTGDGYIANQATYDSAYTSYLNGLITLSSAKTTRIGELEFYANDVKNNHVLVAGNEFFSGSNDVQKLINEDVNYTRVGALPGSYYVNDVAYNQITVASLGALENIINYLISLYYLCDVNTDTHRTAINALTTVSAVQSYAFTSGWPYTPYNAALTLHASYASSINADYAAGVATGTATGGAAVSGAYLDLAHSDTRYVSYSATSNADAQQIGTVAFIYKPNYSGSPAADMEMFAISENSGSANNLLTLRHTSAGQLNLLIKNNVGTNITDNSLGAWSPTSGTDYSFCLHYNLTGGSNILRIDNVQFGATDTNTGTRSASIGLLAVGADYAGTSVSNFYIKNFRFCAD